MHRLTGTRLILAVVGFGLVALAIIFVANASLRIIGLESGQASTEGPADVVSDAAASGGDFVEFGRSGNGTIEQFKQQGIVIIGDSLLHQNGAYQVAADRLQANGWSNIVISAQGCRAISEFSVCGVGSVLTLREMLVEVQNKTYDYPTDPEKGIATIGNLNTGIRNVSTIVISLGSNDKTPRGGGGNPSAAEIETKIDTVIGMIRGLNSDADIHWVRPCRLRSGSVPEHIVRGVVDQVAPRYDLETPDWANACRPEYLQIDQLHYVPDGSEAYGLFLADSSEPNQADL